MVIISPYKAAACTYGINVFLLDAADERKCLVISSCTEGSQEVQTHT